MLRKMLKKDISRNKSISVVLFIFIMLSALLVASGSNMIMELSNSLNHLFTKSNAPHYVQMHTGEIDQAEVARWASNHNLVEKVQAPKMLNIDGSTIHLDSNSSTTEINSVMDHYFVAQNRSFDFLLNLDNQVIEVSKGEIAVPIYYMQQKNMKIGDKVTLSNQKFEVEFTVAEFVRDIQMNPSIIHSKRFVVHEMDLNRLEKNFGEVEYLIEFQLKDISKLSQFEEDYQASGLPQKGPSIDFSLFKILNAIADGIVVVVIILVSLLLNIIAILCIRFTILAAIEEDYKEIGVMKAIGIDQRDIKRLYLYKYLIMTGLASAIGYFSSFFLNQVFTANIMLYIGSAPKSLLLHILPFCSVLLLFMIVMLFCLLTLRRFNKITAVEALRSGTRGETFRNNKVLKLHTNKFFNLPIFLGLRDVLQRFKMYRLLLFVFIVCSFIIIVPVNFYNTIQSPGFIKYMGIEKSDMRIDLQQTDLIVDKYNQMIAHIKNDEDIERFSPLVTSQFKFLNEDGIQENLSVQSGDFSIFPLEYLKGAAPIDDNEIALSYLNGKELGKKVGDRIQFVINGHQKELVVSGIYQDVTNGGRTAKAILPYNPETVVWYVVNLDVRASINLQEKTAEYAKLFSPARVTDLKEYVAQTLGNTIGQLRLLTILAVVIAIFIAILITSLFLKMLIAKDYAQTAIMKSIGFSTNHIRTQYITRALLLLSIGAILGTVLANTIGQRLVSALLSFMGATRIQFEVDPVEAYIFAPLTLMVVVTVTTVMSITAIQKTTIFEMNAD